LGSEKRDGSVDHWPLGITQARDVTQRSRAMRSVALVDFYGSMPIPVIDGNNVTRLRRALVSGNYFDVLGVRAIVGRAFGPSDDVVGAAPVVVISHATWQRQYGADRSVIGRKFTIQLDGLDYTIVGVMPPGLEYPTG